MRVGRVYKRLAAMEVVHWIPMINRVTLVAESKAKSKECLRKDGEVGNFLVRARGAMIKLARRKRRKRTAEGLKSSKANLAARGPVPPMIEARMRAGRARG